MNLKEVKEKQSNISFFLSYLEISKISILRQLIQEQRKLKNLEVFKKFNVKLLKDVSKKWSFIANKMHELDDDKIKNKSTLYILVDPHKINKISEQMLKKLEEKMSKIITNNDYVITFGSNVNSISQKLELNIIDSYGLDDYFDEVKFSEIISSMVDVGIKNNIFHTAELFLSEIAVSSQKLLSEKLYPFIEYKDNDITTEMSLDLEDEDYDKNFEILRLYEQEFKSIDITKVVWEPNIDFFLDGLSRSILKQIVHKLKLKSEIERLKLELQLLEDKRNKLLEQLVLLERAWNRIRKEEATNQSLLLYSAFKTKEDDGKVPLFKVDSKGRRV